MSLNDSAPIYTTRKSAHGDTGSYSQTIWMSLLVQLLLWINAALWGCIGIAEAGIHMVGWF